MSSSPEQIVPVKIHAPISLRIRLRYPDPDTFVEKYAPNISRGGIFIQSRAPQPVGTKLRFELLLQDNTRLLKGEGHVVWVKDYDVSQPTQAHGMGVRFTSMDDQSQLMVERVLRFKEGGQIRTLRESATQEVRSLVASAAPADAEEPQQRAGTGIHQQVSLPSFEQQEDRSNGEILMWADEQLQALLQEAGVPGDGVDQTLARVLAAAVDISDLGELEGLLDSEEVAPEDPVAAREALRQMLGAAPVPAVAALSTQAPAVAAPSAEPHRAEQELDEIDQTMLDQPSFEQPSEAPLDAGDEQQNQLEEPLDAPEDQSEDQSELPPAFSEETANGFEEFSDADVLADQPLEQFDDEVSQAGAAIPTDEQDLAAFDLSEGDFEQEGSLGGDVIFASRVPEMPPPGEAEHGWRSAEPAPPDRPGADLIGDTQWRHAEQPTDPLSPAETVDNEPTLASSSYDDQSLITSDDDPTFISDDPPDMTNLGTDPDSRPMGSDWGEGPDTVAVDMQSRPDIAAGLAPHPGEEEVFDALAGVRELRDRPPQGGATPRDTEPSMDPPSLEALASRAKPVTGDSETIAEDRSETFDDLDVVVDDDDGAASKPSIRAPRSGLFRRLFGKD